MSWSQIVIVGWLQFALASFGIFWLARCALRRMPQPVDRIRIIQCTLAATTLLPLLIAVAPWPAWRLEIVFPVQEVNTTTRQTDISLPESTESPFQSAQVAHFAIDEMPIAARSEMTETAVANRHSAIPIPPPKLNADVIWNRVPGRQAWKVAAGLILALHSFALIFFLGLRCLGRVQLRRLIHTAVPAHDFLLQSWNRITKHQGNKVRLLVSSSLEVPLMYGWRHPVVLIPQKLVHAGGAALNYCLVHEWAHIERHDFLVWRGVDACQMLFWLQPAYWAMRKELRLCQDLLADNRSTRVAGDAIEYSALLVEFARQRMAVPVTGALSFMDHPSHLSRRVKMLLERTFLVRARCTWKFSLAAVTAVGLLVLVIGGIRIEVTRADEATDKTESANATADSAAKTEEPTPIGDEPFVALTYSCSVVDKETGKGIANANVIVRRSHYAGDSEQIVEVTNHTTDADGKYDIVIPPEQVAERGLFIELAVEHKDYATKSVYRDDLRTMRKNERRGERPYFERSELYPGAQVTGMIVTPDGQPLAGAKIFGFSTVAGLGSQGWSRTRATSADDGTFRVVFHKNGEAALWVIPKDFAVVKKFLAGQRGDLGTIQLSRGVRLSGQVLGIERGPIAGVMVNIEFANRGDTGSLPISPVTFREAISDLHGRVTFDPLPPGDYRVTVEDHSENLLSMDQTRYDVPAVFVPKKVHLNGGSATADVEIQAVPHIVFHAQNLDSAGGKTRKHPIDVYGNIDGERWTATGNSDRDGAVSLKVPCGLRESVMGVWIGGENSLRFRLGKGQPLRDAFRSIEIGTLNDDIEGIEVIHYKSPIVLVSAVDGDGKAITKLQIKARYAKPRPEAYYAFENGSDIPFELQRDGAYQTRYMLPDEDMMFNIAADGYAPIGEKINLKEGEMKELVVTMKKAEGSADRKTSSEAPAKELPAALKYVCSVLDKETGKGIFGADVFVKQVTTSALGERIVRESKHSTDASGNYPLEIPAELIADPTRRFEFRIEHENYAATRRQYSALAISEKLKSHPKFERIELLSGQAVTGVVVSPDGRSQPNITLQSFWITAPPGNVHSSSFHFTRTDSQGKFRIVVPKGAEAVLWALPKDFAPVEKLVPKERGDLGLIRLSPGIRVSGTVLGVNGKPLPKTLINIEYVGDRNIGNIPVSTSVSRGTFTDAEGRFAFDPLPPGDYRIEPGEYLQENSLQDDTHYPLQGVFRSQKVSLKDGVNPGAQQIQALPHIVFKAKFVDSAGQLTSGHQIAISGRMDGGIWQSNTIPVPRGEVSMYVPHGLGSAKLQLINNDLRAERYRLAKGKPLVNFPVEFGDIEIGTLNDDLDEFEVVRYQAPMLFVSAIDQNQKPIPDFRVRAKSPKGQQPIKLEDGIQSDVGLYREADGRFQSARMLPDEDFTITVSADGYEPIDSQVNLKEGETKDLIVTMKQSRKMPTTSPSK